MMKKLLFTGWKRPGVEGSTGEHMAHKGGGGERFNGNQLIPTDTICNLHIITLYT